MCICVSGLTHASVWAAGCSYMTQAVPVDNRPTAQMILHSLHHAFGRGCGALIGGAIINKYGRYTVIRSTLETFLCDKSSSDEISSIHRTALTDSPPF